MLRLTALVASSLLASSASAHFLLAQPDSHIGGGDASNQDEGPCGGHTPSSDDDTVDFYVGGDAVAVQDLHSASDWIIRGMLGSDAQGEWEQLYPVYGTRGEGRSCQPRVQAPENWAGERGLISIVGSATDGILYACAAVDFVNGTGPDDRSGCSNATDISISFTDNSDLSDLVGSGSAESSSSPTSDSGSSDDDSGDDDSAAMSLQGGALGGIALSAVAFVGGAVLMM